MNVSISGDNVEVTQAMRDALEKVIAKVSKICSDIIDFECVIGIEGKGLRQTVECKVNLPKKTLFAEATDKDMYRAMDEVRDKLSTQITHYKEKHSHH